MNTINNLKSIEIIEEKEMMFMDTSVPIFRADDGLTYMPFQFVCDLLQLNFEEEISRVLSHEVLFSGVREGHHPNSEINTVLMRVGLSALWLTTLPIIVFKHIRVQEELTAYQQEAAQVLEEAFFEGKLTERPFIAQMLEHNTLKLEHIKKR